MSCDGSCSPPSSLEWMCFLSAKVEFGSLNREGAEVWRSPMKYVALREEEVGGGEQKEGRGPWHFLTNLTSFFFSWKFCL